MGNCFALYIPKRKSWARAAVARDNKVLQVVKADGKILEYEVPMLIKDILMNFSSYGIGTSDEALQLLPPDYELKIGHVYYLLPLSSPVIRPVTPAGSSPSLVDSDGISGVKRIKVIITKQQLQELQLKKISVEEMLSGLRKKAWDGVDSSTRWRPMLETIPEGSE